jgi:hypothetical protein
MKRKIVALFFILFYVNSYSQTTDRDYIGQKIRIRFIPHPNTPPLEIIRIPVSRVLNTSGFIFGTANENGMDVCARFLKQLLRPIGEGDDEGKRELQRTVANTLRITGDSVIVNIYKDDQPLNLYAKANYLQDTSYRYTHVWPAAWRNDTGPNASGSNHTGNIHFGKNFASSNGLIEMKRTFIHEITHTQDFSDVRTHIWGNFRYGGIDEGHYGFELIPNMSDAFGEGIANSMTYIYSTITRNQTIRWFSNNDYCIIEMPPGDDVIRRNGLPPRSEWIYPQISNTNPPGAGLVSSVAEFANYRVYRLAEMPSRFLMHNEQIIGMIGAEYALKLGRDKYYQALRSGNANMFRVSTSAHARWFEALSQAAMPDGLRMSDIRSVSRTEMPYLFALALADYFTYYRSNTAADFRAMFENSLSEDWVDLYWTAGRLITRGVAPITLTGGRPPVLNVRANIDAIATALGIRNP